MSDMEKERNDSFRYGPFEFTPNSLKAVTSYDETDLIALGAHCRKIGSAIQWWFGDWYMLLEQRCDDRAAKLAEDLKYSPRTIENWGSLSKRFPVERRRDTLTWSHHRIVASLPEKEQERLLDLAERRDMSKNVLGQHVRNSHLQLEAIASGDLPSDPLEVEDDVENEETSDMEDLNESVEADLRIKMYKKESDREKMKSACDSTSLVRMTMVQIRSLLQQIMDYSENNPDGKFLTSAALKTAWFNVSKALQPGIPVGVCGSCGGTGKKEQEECTLCRGLGWLPRGRHSAQKKQFKI